MYRYSKQLMPLCHVIMWYHVAFAVEKFSPPAIKIRNRKDHIGETAHPVACIVFLLSLSYVTCPIFCQYM